MSSVTDADLRGLLRDADPATATAFVADLFEARGYAVDRVGDQRIVAESDGEMTTIAVRHPDGKRRHDDGAIDQVVTIDEAGWNGAGDAVAVTALHRQLAYAVDRPIARTLLETHFGWAPADASPAGTATTGQSDVTGGTLQQSGQGRALAAVALVVALLAGSAVALAGTDGGVNGLASSATGTSDETPATPDGTSETDQSQSTDSTATPAPVTPAEERTGESGDTNRYDDAPPGIVAPDKVNIYDAAGAFWDELNGESYQLSITYREYASGYLMGAYLETLRVESNERYAVDVSRVGRTERQPLTIAKVDQYANGSVRYLRFENGSVSAEPTTSYDPFMFNATQYLGWFLSSENSSIDSRETQGNTTVYRVLTEGDLDPRFIDARGTIYTTEAGLVQYARWEYRPADHPDLRVVFEMRVTEVGSTRVRAPDWVSNETVQAFEGTVRSTNETAETNRTAGQATATAGTETG